jgi:hypothetical protein
MLARQPSSGPVVGFGVDTFAFRNDSRIHRCGKPDIHCNRCFLMARAVGQFRRFTRFAPDGPRLEPVEYAARVWRGVRRAAWRAPLPAARRVVIPGHPSLHAFSAAEEAAVKAGLQGRFAVRRAGRPVQLCVTDFSRIELNPSVLAFDYRTSGPDTVDFVVHDPNDPAAPGIVRFDRRDERFHPAPRRGVAVPTFRAFRQYYSPLF